MKQDINVQVAPTLLEQVQEYVAECYPELSDAEYSVETRTPHQLSASSISKVQEPASSAEPDSLVVREPSVAYIAAAPAHRNGSSPPTPPAPHYTVTLRKNVLTASGAILPRIARFIVDGKGNILKFTSSK